MQQFGTFFFVNTHQSQISSIHCEDQCNTSALVLLGRSDLTFVTLRVMLGLQNLGQSHLLSGALSLAVVVSIFQIRCII